MYHPMNMTVVVPARQAYSHCDSVGRHRPNLLAGSQIAERSGGSGRLVHHPRNFLHWTAWVVSIRSAWDSNHWYCLSSPPRTEPASPHTSEVKSMSEWRHYVRSQLVPLPASVIGLPMVKVPGGHQIISIATVAFRSTVWCPSR